MRVRRPAGQLREAASVARSGFHQQNGAKQSVLDAVADAEVAGFEVNEDLSVDGWFTGTDQAYVAARAQAQALSAQIRHRAALLMSSNQEIATRIAAAAGNLREFRFDEPAGAGPPLDTKAKSHDQRTEPTAHVQNAAWVSPKPPAATAPPTDGAALDDGGLVMRLVPPSQVSPSSPTTPTLPAPSGGATPGTAATPLPAAPIGGSIPRSGGTASGFTADLAALSAKSAAIAAQASTSAASGTASVISAPVAAVTQVVPSAAVAVHPQQELHSPDLAAPQPVNPLSAQLLSPGEAQHEQAPPAPPSTPAQHPPAPSQLLTPPLEPASPPAEPQSSQHSTSSGLGSPGFQMLGFGPGSAPQAPPFPLPLDPSQPIPPPPPIEEMTKEQALEEWDKLNNDKANYTGRCDPKIVGALPPGPYSACMREFGELNAREAALRARLGQLGVPIADGPAPLPVQPSSPGNEPTSREPDAQDPPGASGGGPQLIDEVPLQTDRGQIEAKFKHAQDFGVTDQRGRAGFDNFDRAVRQVVDDPATMHIRGAYRGQPAILNYNPQSGLCVIQNPDGTFVSGFELTPTQIDNVVNRGALGGGE